MHGTAIAILCAPDWRGSTFECRFSASIRIHASSNPVMCKSDDGLGNASTFIESVVNHYSSDLTIYGIVERHLRRSAPATERKPTGQRAGTSKILNRIPSRW